MMNRIDKLFLELNGVEVLYDRVIFKNYYWRIIDDKITADNDFGFHIFADFSNVEETIQNIRELEDSFKTNKELLWNIINTPIEEKKKYICEHLEDLDNTR